MRFIIPLLLTIFLAAPSHAEFIGPGAASNSREGGFQGPVSGAIADNAAAAKSLPDNSPVVLTGNIISRVAGAKKKYVFRDNSGEIVVEIAPKQFKGMRVTPETTVRLTGKVDQDFGQEAEVEVNDIFLVN